MHCFFDFFDEIGCKGTAFSPFTQIFFFVFSAKGVYLAFFMELAPSDSPWGERLAPTKAIPEQARLPVAFPPVGEASCALGLLLFPIAFPHCFSPLLFPIPAVAPTRSLSASDRWFPLSRLPVALPPATVGSRASSPLLLTINRKL